MRSAITFWGGAGSVTGANFLLETGTKKILIDCGSREQNHTCDPVNFEAFPYDPKEIDVLVVTHAHADHIGRVPRLVHEGFKGTIYSTHATRDLAALMFDDSVSVMHDEHKLKGCDILYEKPDADAALSLWHGLDYHQPIEVGDITIELFDAGHILGSAMVKLSRDGKAILFTGDLGNSPEPLLPDTEAPEGINYLVMESVYGDRKHEAREQRADMLKSAVEEARTKGGVLLIPSFSIERTQIILYELNNMIESKEIEPIPVFLDAPLAIKVTDVYRKYPQLLNEATRKHFENHDDPFAFQGLTETPDIESSREIHDAPNPKVIIAGAGMSVGGRVRSHEKRYLQDPNATVLFVGYQAVGSLGRRVEDGEKKVNIDGEQIKVHARIESITGYSGHRDRDGLLDFVESLGETVKKVFVTMGEPKSSMFLGQRIKDFLGIEAVVPQAAQKVEINL